MRVIEESVCGRVRGGYEGYRRTFCVTVEAGNIGKERSLDWIMVVPAG
jgi:hypothetical protein